MLTRLFTVAAVIAMCCACSGSANKDDAQRPTTDSPTPDLDGADPGHVRPGLDRETPLPALARKLLLDNMWNHGEAMENLLWSALMLDHELTEMNARKMLASPKMSRPVPEAGETLNDHLPMTFFELQDQMYVAAQDLADAANARDDAGSADAYARLAKTCIGCHSVYLRIPGEQ
jgi:cytochrome c556